MSSTTISQKAASLPKWAVYLLFPFAWFFLNLLARPAFWIRGRYDRLCTWLYVKIKVREGKERKAFIKQIKLLIMDFNDIGRRSDYIPKEIKTKPQMRDHIYYWHRDELKKFNMVITPKLKIIQK